MRVGFDLFEGGISVRAGASQYPITYPEEIWRAFPPKAEFASELVSLLTYGIPIATGEREIVYDFQRPKFLDRYHDWFRLNVPYLIERNPSASPQFAPEALAGIERKFRTEPRTHSFPIPATSDRRAVVALTMGKDSLASLALGREMNIDLMGVYCYHPSLSDDYQIRIPHMLALGAKLGIPVHSVSDRVHELTRSLFDKNQPNDMMWSMAVAVYCLMLLPFAHHYQAGLLVLGNGFEFNYPMRLTGGGPPIRISPLQTWEGEAMLDEWMGLLTGGAVRVTSWIRSLHAIACHKLVHSIRPDFGLHQVSCRRSPSADNPRWCQQCQTCAENFLFIKAMGRDPAALGFTRTLFDQSDAMNFQIVRNGLDEGDPYRLHAARQELLGFSLAGCDGEESWMCRHVLAKHGDLLGPRIEELKREYLEPVHREAPLAMSDEATVVARRLLSMGR